MTRILLLSIFLATIAFCQSTPSADEQSRGILDKALKESNPDTRKQAVIALSLAGTSEAFLTQVESMLDDKDVEVRLAAVASLVDLPSERTTAKLHKALNACKKKPKKARLACEAKARKAYPVKAGKKKK